MTVPWRRVGRACSLCHLRCCEAIPSPVPPSRALWNHPRCCGALFRWDTTTPAPMWHGRSRHRGPRKGMGHPRKVYGRRAGAHTDRRRRTSDVRRVPSASSGAARPSRALCDWPRVCATITSAVRTSLTLWHHPGRYGAIPRCCAAMLRWDAAAPAPVQRRVPSSARPSNGCTNGSQTCTPSKLPSKLFPDQHIATTTPASVETSGRHQIANTVCQYHDTV